jgi:hypothetical protein
VPGTATVGEDRLSGGLDAWFVSGTIDGEPVAARWDPVARRISGCHPELLRRAEIVVALGEEFGVPGSRESVSASLTDGPVPALLTVIRAIDNILTIDLETAVATARMAAGNVRR